MTYTAEVEHMCPLAKGAYHGPAPIPEEGEWVKVKKIEDVSGFTHGIGWCAPQQGACKLSLNVKNGIIEEALVETIGCSGMTHSAAMASEILLAKFSNSVQIVLAVSFVSFADEVKYSLRCSSILFFNMNKESLFSSIGFDLLVSLPLELGFKYVLDSTGFNSS